MSKSFDERFRYRPRKYQDKRARDLILTQEYLNKRVSKTFGKQKWIIFSETLLKEGYNLSMYEAKRTLSKYITINGEYTVRISNHAPNKQREENKDCDFFVGHTNFGIRTIYDALYAVRKYFRTKAVEQC